jgi:hypothetical protein
MVRLLLYIEFLALLLSDDAGVVLLLVLVNVVVIRSHWHAEALLGRVMVRYRVSTRWAHMCSLTVASVHTTVVGN